MQPSSEFADLLKRWSDGDAAAFEALVPVVYEELRTADLNDALEGLERVDGRVCHVLADGAPAL